MNQLVGCSEIKFEIGASRSFATASDLKGPTLAPSHEIKHMAVKKEAMIRLREEMNLSLVDRPADMKFIPILRSTSISEEDRMKALSRHRRAVKRAEKTPHFCFACKRFPFGQTLCNEQDQLAHYKNCPPAIEFERKVILMMEKLRDDPKIQKQVNRKRAWTQIQNSEISFSDRSAKEKSDIIATIYNLPEFPA